MPPFLLLASLICLATTSAQPVFNYSSSSPTTSWSGFTFMNTSVSSNSLLLDGTVFADAYYSTSITLSGHSFSSFFTFSSNYSTGTGALAFVVVREPPTSGSSEIEVIESTTNAFGVVFNTTCPSAPRDSQGPGWDGPAGDLYTELNGGGYQISEFANGSSVAPSLVSTSQPAWNGEGPWPYCSPQLPPEPWTDVSLSYQTWIEYNATTKQVTVAITSCDSGTWLPWNISQDLTDVLTKPAYVGLVAEKGAIYQISQWNFTNNPTSSALADISLASVTSTTTSETTSSGDSSGSSNTGTPSPSSGSKLSKGYIAGFSVLGAGIGVAVLCGVCLLWRRPVRKSAKRVYGVGAEGASFETAIKMQRAAAAYMDVKPATERDTSPLNTGNSAFQQLSGTASWLKPGAAR